MIGDSSALLALSSLPCRSPNVAMPESPIRGWPGVAFDARTEVEHARMGHAERPAGTARAGRFERNRS